MTREGLNSGVYPDHVSARPMSMVVLIRVARHARTPNRWLTFMIVHTRL